MTEVEHQEQLDRVLLFAGHEQDGYHRGVVGIVCSKLVEWHGPPGARLCDQ